MCQTRGQSQGSVQNQIIFKTLLVRGQLLRFPLWLYHWEMLVRKLALGRQLVTWLVFRVSLLLKLQRVKFIWKIVKKIKIDLFNSKMYQLWTEDLNSLVDRPINCSQGKIVAILLNIKRKIAPLVLRSKNSVFDAIVLQFGIKYFIENFGSFLFVPPA